MSIESEKNTKNTPRPLSRRTFLATAAGACGAAALWTLKPSFVSASGKGASLESATVTIVQFSPAGKKIGKVVLPRVVKTEAAWKQQLSPLSFEITRHAATERPYSGSTWNLHEKGIFHCICCDTPAFDSDTKFESGTGWPSFWQPIAKENIVETTDHTLGMARTAVSCRLCDAHLGHVFDDGPQPTGLRYCMNSEAMHFVKHA